MIKAFPVALQTAEHIIAYRLLNMNFDYLANTLSLVFEILARCFNIERVLSTLVR